MQVVGFGSSVVVATQLGATPMTDAYYLALSVPFVAYSILLAAVRLGAVPSLMSVAEQESAANFAKSCSEVVSATVVIAALLSVCVTAVMLLALPAAASHQAHLAALTRTYMIELAPYAVTGGALGALGAILAVRRTFAVPALMLGCEPLLKCVLLVLFPQLGAQALVIGSLVGNLLAAMVLWALVRRRGIALRLVRFRSSSLVRKVFSLTLPLAVGESVLQLNPLIDRTIAAGLGPGNVTAFELGVRLFAAPATILGATLIAPLAPAWSARLAKEGWAPVGRSFSRVVAAVVILVPPLALAGFLVRHDLIALIYSSHAYNPLAVSRTADVFGVLLLGLVAQILVAPLATLFLVQGDTVFPMKVAIANAGLNAILDLILRGPFGLRGIAASTTVTYMIVCALYCREAHRRWGSLHLRSLIRPLLVSGASAIALAVSCAMVFGLSDSSTSRSQQIEVAAMVLGMAALIHALCVMVGRAGGAVGLPMKWRWTALPALRRKETVL